MPIIDSPFWDLELGVCTKHFVPQIPCPKCLAEQDPNVEVRLTKTDRLVIDFEPGMSIRALLPAPHADWLSQRGVA